MYVTLREMSLNEFCIRLGLYDVEFSQTLAYDSLLISRPVGESQEDAWKRFSTNTTYDLCRSKASTFRSPALRYIHFVLNYTLTGQGDSTRVVSQ